MNEMLVMSTQFEVGIAFKNCQTERPFLIHFDRHAPKTGSFLRLRDKSFLNSSTASLVEGLPSQEDKYGGRDSEIRELRQSPHTISLLSAAVFSVK